MLSCFLFPSPFSSPCSPSMCSQSLDAAVVNSSDKPLVRCTPASPSTAHLLLVTVTMELAQPPPLEFTQAAIGGRWSSCCLCRWRMSSSRRRLEGRCFVLTITCFCNQVEFSWTRCEFTPNIVEFSRFWVEFFSQIQVKFYLVEIPLLIVFRNPVGIFGIEWFFSNRVEIHLNRFEKFWYFVLEWKGEPWDGGMPTHSSHVVSMHATTRERGRVDRGGEKETCVIMGNALHRKAREVALKLDALFKKNNCSLLWGIT